MAGFLETTGHKRNTYGYRPFEKSEDIIKRSNAKRVVTT